MKIFKSKYKPAHYQYDLGDEAYIFNIEHDSHTTQEMISIRTIRVTIRTIDYDHITAIDDMGVIHIAHTRSLYPTIIDYSYLKQLDRARLQNVQFI